MLMERYQEAIDALFAKIRLTQKDAIVKAGEMVAECVTHGGCVFLMNIVHYMEHDLVYRGGGPIFYKLLSYDLHIENQARARDRSDLGIEEEGLDARYVLQKSNIRPGDVIFVSSVSGRTKKVVDFTYEAEKFGAKVIAMTSMEYARQVEPVHSSGKKLYEMASLVLDNCAPAAEAILDVEGIEAKYAAVSGIASNYILWSLTSVAVEKMLAQGYTPGILKSANFPGGMDYNLNVIHPHYDEYGW